jgi:hypothetical protein
MKSKQRWHARAASVTFLALAVSLGCGRAPEPAPLVATTPDPAQMLRAMFDTLSKAQQLTFKATRQLDAALVIGGSVAESARIDVSVSRPQTIRARSVSDAGARVLYADGQNVSLIDETMNVYATSPLAGTIDEMVNALDARYGFTPPLAEFILNDPQTKFATQIQGSQYKGKETLDGVECDRVTLAGEVADADVWIAIADHLPRKFVATFKDREGSPQLKVDFSDWNLTATLEESVFVFDPPKDAEKIDMAPVDDANASDGKGGTK